MLTPGQVRAARCLLGWSQVRLAEECGLAVGTIRRMETKMGLDRTLAGNVEKVRACLEQNGLEFIEDDGERGPGVRLRRSGRKSKT